MKVRAKTSAMIASYFDAGQRTTPAPFGYALIEAAEANERIVGLSADLAKYTDMHIFRDALPDRFFQMGMAEQALFGAAAGLAEVGLIPFASTYSVFATRRAYDMICLDIAEPKLNVNILGALPGLTTGYGPSHQATEDIAILRAMPNLVILDPADATDVAAAVPAMAAWDGPTYMRLPRGQVPLVLDEYDYEFTIGPAFELRSGRDISLIATGLMTPRALEVARRLEKAGVDAAVTHVPTIKPIDIEGIVRAAGGGRLVVTIENHSTVGGLGDAVLSALAERGALPSGGLRRIALPDEFLDAGALPTLHDRYGISTDSVEQRVRAWYA